MMIICGDQSPQDALGPGTQSRGVHVGLQGSTAVAIAVLVAVAVLADRSICVFGLRRPHSSPS